MASVMTSALLHIQSVFQLAVDFAVLWFQSVTNILPTESSLHQSE